MMDKVKSKKKKINENESMETGESSDLTLLQNVPRTTEENCGILTFDATHLERSVSDVLDHRILENVSPTSTVPEVEDLEVNRSNCDRMYSSGTIKKHKSKKSSNKKHVNPLAEEITIESGGDERRIVDIQYYTFNLLNQISNHSPFDCGVKNIEFHSEQRLGLSSKLTFRCKMCNTKFQVSTCDPKPKNTLDVSTAAVTGMTVTGIGLAQQSELFAAMNLPQMSQTTYAKIHNTISKKWEESAEAAMMAAGKRERDAAIAEGHVKDGLPVIDVIADGCWGKRSYKKNYSSLSGAAAILGRRFGEVLYLGVRNKYCSICTLAENKNSTPKEHTCYKNYTGASTGMESDIIVEGFKHSIDMHQMIYGRLIADGDCSTYNKIIEARPYKNVTVEKIECKNHLLRNMCNKLVSVASDTRYPLAHRKLLTTQRILAIRKAICLAIKENSTKNESSQRVKDLYCDVSNSYNHAFGEHNSCKNYYCESKKKSENLTTNLNGTAMWTKIQFIVAVLASNSRSLVHDVTSNRVECFNSVVAKLVGGKRINLSARQTYQTRCHASVVSFNTKQPVYTLQKNILGLSPKCKSKLLGERRIRKNILCKSYARRKIKFSNKCASDKHYGESCQKPDLTDEELTQLKETFLKNLKKTEEEVKRIERATVLQRDSSDWLELRRQLITASNFGKIVKKRDSTNSSIVKALLYKSDLSNVKSIKYGVENEGNALKQLSAQLNVDIQPCGLFIDPDIPYLGATPDGLIGTNKVVEIKCPISASKSMSVREAVQKKKLPFYKLIQGNLVVNRNHDWYFQVQGQLHITRRKSCIFGIWLGEDKPLHVEIIEKDDFFSKKMLPMLSSFYDEQILPELLDPRKTRNLPLRGSKRKEDSFMTTSSCQNKKQKVTETNETCINFEEF